MAAPGVKRPRPLGPTGHAIPKHGDTELKLTLEGLNGFEAMMATMKEMGYESEEEEEEADIEAGNAPTAAATAPSQVNEATPISTSDAVTVATGCTAVGGVTLAAAEATPSRTSTFTIVWVVCLIITILVACGVATVLVIVFGEDEVLG